MPLAVVAAQPVPTSKPDSPKVTMITPNWCDRTTWYPQSAYVLDEEVSDSGDHLTYSLVNQNIIDTYHGKITFEETLKDALGRSYRVVVKVNGTTKTERDPEIGSGGDYTINYAAGTVTFFQALQPTDVVTVTYHYSYSSEFVVKPTEGKILSIFSVELQISDDLVMNDTAVFQPYGLVEIFAPELMPGIPQGTKIPLGDPLVYKTLQDFLNDSNKAYPSYPALGSSNWRGISRPSYVFVWDYIVGATWLHSAYGMEIRIQLRHDTPCGGSFATATLYCTSEDET